MFEGTDALFDTQSVPSNILTNSGTTQNLLMQNFYVMAETLWMQTSLKPFNQEDEM